MGGGGNGPVRGMFIYVIFGEGSGDFEFEGRDFCAWFLRSVSFHGAVTWGVCEG